MLKRLILALVILCYAVLASALKPDPEALVAKVGDRSYNYKKFNDGFKAYLSYNMGKKTITAQDSIRLNDQYWSELVGVYIYDQAIKAGKVKATDAEIEKDILANPPDGVKIIKDFQTNGVFDTKKYKQALKDRPDFKKSVIDLSRSLFTYNKLVKTIKNEATVSQDSIKAEWMRENTKADASVILFDYNRLQSVAPTEEQMQRYYNDNMAESKRENGRTYLYVRFPRNKTEGEDTQAVMQNLKASSGELKQRAKEIGIAKAALEMDMQTAESGIFGSTDTEIPGIGYAPKLVSYAFENPAGTVGDVFYAPNGDYYVYEVLGVLPQYYLDFSAQKKTIEQSLTKQLRIDRMREFAAKFRAGQSAETFTAAALKDSLFYQEVEGITATSPIKQLGLTPAFNQAILDTPEGSLTPLIERENRWLLAKVNKQYRPDPAVWERDKQSIITATTNKLQQEHLNKWYKQEYDKLEITDNRKDFYILVRPQTPVNKANQ